MPHVQPRWRRAAGRLRTAGASALSSGTAVGVVVALLVLARSAVFVFWEQAHFDSNQAVIGLMAKHLAELRAFPVFMYGQNYMLAVEAWLAAPVFLAAGVSVTALKLPLLAINLTVALLLYWLLVKEAGLRPIFAGLATIFFVLPSPGTAAKLLEASGGIVEPLLYIPLLWLTRRRPAWCGLVLGLGFVHREFTIYGFAALLMLDAGRGRLFTRADLRRLWSLVRTAAEVWLVVQVARQYGAAMGPGTTPADLPRRAQDIVELANRFCLDWAAVPGGFLDIARVHWPLLFGTAARPLRDFMIESHVTQGMAGAGVLLGAAMALAAARIVVRVLRERGWRSDYDFCAYLVLVGALSVTGYVVSRCGVITLARMRYEMLSILGAVGLAGWYLGVERSRGLRAAWIALVLSWVAVGAASHTRLWTEYLTHPPAGGKRQIARHMEARGFSYGIADYATAYPVTFLTDEQIIMASSTRVRIQLYQDAVAAHRGQAVRVGRRPCAGGLEVMPGVHFCPP